MIIESLNENLRFIVLETAKQLDSTLAYIREPEDMKYRDIIERDNYVDNLKVTIEDLCFSRLASPEIETSKADADVVRAVHIIAVNLERIADNCVNIIRQTDHLDNISFMYDFKYEDMLNLLIRGVRKIPQVFEGRRLNDALDVCKIEDETDIYYKKNLARILAMLESGGHTRNLVTVLFIYRYLERMGDSLLNIGEALMIGIVGEKIRISQIESLSRNLENTGAEDNLDGMSVRAYLGTRSGCRISKVKLPASGDDSYRNSIFKEGTVRKIKAEKEAVETWNRLIPGIAPRVFSYREDTSSASILMEFLDGNTLDEIVLNAEQAQLKRAFETFVDTVEKVWLTTKKPGPFPVDYVRQIKSRLSRVRDVHPNFFRFEQSLGDSRIFSSEELIETCGSLEKQLTAPFTVRIHGDFNVNNIMFDMEKMQVRYIDIHRSADADYVQDASVFLISNFRLPVFGEKRNRLNWMIRNFFAYARSFATNQQDETFDFRMTLALARSLYTSTRFELNLKLAKEMYLRAHYLLDKMATHVRTGPDVRVFRLPDSVLYY